MVRALCSIAFQIEGVVSFFRVLLQRQVSWTWELRHKSNIAYQGSLTNTSHLDLWAILNIEIDLLPNQVDDLCSEH